MSGELPRRLARRILLDVTPLRRSRDYRALISGLGVSVLGNQLTTVAVPFQVYAITRSSLMVGLVSLAQLFPLIFGSLLGGSLVDAVDRRRLLLIVEGICACCSAGLALNADLGPALWPLFLLPAITASQSGIDSSARNAMLPGLVGMELLPASNAIFQSLFQTGAIVGPAVAGLLLAGAGVHVIYWIDVASYLVAMTAVLTMSPQPPPAAGTPGGAVARPGWRSTLEGLRFVRRSQPVLGAYVIDVNAMVFGMPRALFPALAATVFGGGATTVGLLYAAPGAGALLGALTSGWVGRVRRQGLAVICAVLVWGASIALFGIAHWLAPAPRRPAGAGWAGRPGGGGGRAGGGAEGGGRRGAAPRGPRSGRGRHRLRGHRVGGVRGTRVRRRGAGGGVGAARVHADAFGPAQAGAAASSAAAGSRPAGRGADSGRVTPLPEPRLTFPGQRRVPGPCPG